MSALREAFRIQARACDALGSAFMARLCHLLADRLAPGTPLTDRLFDWEGELGPGGESVPLRLCGALHALKLSGRALEDVYPPHNAADDTLWDAVDHAMKRESGFIHRFIDSPPQTNEVRRSVALIAAGHWLAHRIPLPMITRELGASGGLNLMWDRYGLATPTSTLGAAQPALMLHPTWRGAPPEGPRAQVAERAGVDLNPLDPTQADDALRLRAYLWPDQPERLALTNAAVALATPGLVAKGDAVDWLRDHIAPRPGHLRLIYHTIAWQYFPASKQAEGTALIEEAGRAATDDTPLAWLRMEHDGSEEGAALSIRVWPRAPEPVLLARVSFHGQWIDWRGPN